MPTYYTSEIVNNPDICTLKDYMQKCISAFFYDSNAEDLDKNNFEKFLSERYDTSYYDNNVIKFNNELNELKNKSIEEFTEEIIKSFNESLTYYNEELLRVNNVKNKIEKFKESINKIDFDKSYNKYFDFLLKQLDETKDFDCRTSYILENIDEIAEKINKCKTDPNFVLSEYNNKINDLEYQIAYNKNESGKIIEKRNKSKEWLTNLYKIIDSIKDE